MPSTREAASPPPSNGHLACFGGGEGGVGPAQRLVVRVQNVDKFWGKRGVKLCAPATRCVIREPFDRLQEPFAGLLSLDWRSRGGGEWEKLVVEKRKLCLREGQRVGRL